MSKHTNNQAMETEKIDLIRIIDNMWKGGKRSWYLLLGLILFCSGVFYIREYRSYSPVYSANATFTITNDQSSLYTSSSYLNTRTATQIVNTFPFILNSGILQKKIAEDLGTDTDHIPGVITTEPLGSTNMITIVVNSSKPQDAYDILQSVIKHYPEVAEPVIGEVTMNLLDMTDVPESASNPPDYQRDIIKGILLGVALGIGFLLLYAFMRDTIHEEEDFKKLLNIDCICVIPQIVFKRRGKAFRKDISIYNKKISQNFLESIRMLRVRIEKEAKKNDLKVFLVTSAEVGEGKSTIASNVAMALAMKGAKVALVDCDLRNPSVRERLDMEREGAGLCEYLQGEKEIEEVIEWNETYQIHVIPGGEPISNASELIDSPRMYQLLEHLKEQVEYMILDTAPMGILTDTAVLAKAADAALFVVKQDYANKAAILDGIEQLAESKVSVSGCILNGVQNSIVGYGYKTYRYYGKYTQFDIEKER